MSATSGARVMVLVIMALAVVGISVAGCTAPAGQNSPDTAPAGTVGPNGTMSNGLLPERWSETS